MLCDIDLTTRGMATSDGAGVALKRLLGTPEFDFFDPFLMLDEFSSDNPDDYLAGFPDHPHRGFETVTYLLNGRMRHRDSTGREGVIEPGGIQWMTAGSGIIHSEMPEIKEGLLKGYQLWVNLPREHKMTTPAYQEYDSRKLPAVTEGENTIKVIAGTYADSRSPVKTFTEIEYLHLSLKDIWSHSFNPDAQAFLYVIEGALDFYGGDDQTAIDAGTLISLGNGDEVRIEPHEQAECLFISGVPLNEPVYRAGPFVMATQAELKQAFTDYQSGRFIRQES